eukprot:11789381-Alexandrium_andersonii.AAC.1
MAHSLEVIHQLRSGAATERQILSERFGPLRAPQRAIALGFSATAEGLPFGDLGAEVPEPLGSLGPSPRVRSTVRGPRRRGPQMADPFWAPKRPKNVDNICHSTLRPQPWLEQPLGKTTGTAANA